MAHLFTFPHCFAETICDSTPVTARAVVNNHQVAVGNIEVGIFFSVALYSMPLQTGIIVKTVIYVSAEHNIQ